MNHDVRFSPRFRRVAAGWLCGVAALLVTTSGCTSLTGTEPGGWNWKNPFARSKPKMIESKYGEPARIVAIWTPDVLTMPGKQTTRGFGGRLYFYNNRNETIPVDGQLVVYGFDDTDPDQGQTVPEKRFAFTPEQFTQHFSATDLGASYSIWIPWDNGENSHKVVSLVPVFTSTSGHRVVGQQSLNALAGRKPPKQAKKKKPEGPEAWSDPGVQSASFQQDSLAPHASGVQPWGPVTQDELQRVRRQTTTIQMPSTMASRSIYGEYSASAHGENRTIAKNLEAHQFQQQGTLPPPQQPGMVPPPPSAVPPHQFPVPPPQSSAPIHPGGERTGRYPGHPVPTGFNIRAGDQAGQPARFAHHELQAPALTGGQPSRDHGGWQQFPGEQRPSHPSGPQSGHYP